MAPVVRQAFHGALARIGNGEPAAALRNLLETALRDDFVATMSMLAKYEVKEISGSIKHEHDHTHTHTTAELSDTDRIIADAIARGQERALPKPH